MQQRCRCEISDNGVCKVCFKSAEKCDCGKKSFIIEAVRKCQCSQIEQDKNHICGGCCKDKEECICYI